MSASPTSIQPFVITTTQTVTSFTVSCRSLNLFVNATFTVDSFDVNNNLISRQVIPITNQQYLEWNNNDEYIINLMATILGYTLTNPTPASATQKVNIQPTITPPSLTSIPEPTPEPEPVPTEPVPTEPVPTDPVPE
jgi:hypothetical protein